MKWMKKPAYIYTATLFAVALFTVCFIDLEQAKAWLDLFVEMWGQ